MKIKTKHYDYSQPRAGFFIRPKINILFILAIDNHHLRVIIYLRLTRKVNAL